MKIVFIGAGRLATNLAIALYQKSHKIIQVYSQTIESAKLLAEKIESNYTNNIDCIDLNAELYIFSVKDSALESILQNMKPNKALWIHTAGSLPLSLISEYNTRAGVIYPFQTFSLDRLIEFKNIPIFIEANTTQDLNILQSLSKSISDSVYELSSEKRQFVHLTGVFACNFVNCMYTISEKILSKENIPFNIALPLIDETASKVHTLLPLDAQTGPAVRFDTNVMDHHISLIDDESVKKIYKLISQYIYNNNKDKI